MSVDAIARKDFRDAIRSKTLWLLLGLFVLLFLGIAYAAWRVGDAEFIEFVDLTAVVFVLVLPLVAIILGYKSVIAERESGSIVLVLSMAHSRRDLVLGKVIGRLLVLASAVVLGMAISSAVLLLVFDSFPAGRYLLFAGLNVLYGAVFLALAISLSMALSTGRRVTAAAFGAYIVLVMLWDSLVQLILLVLWRFDGSVLSPTGLPDWSFLFRLSSPSESYFRLITALFDSDLGELYTIEFAPSYVNAPVALLVLIAWIVVPLSLAYLRFERTDL